ncbi:interleukin-15 receptor subunit alpha-like isoform X3 [Scyliorhinus canicula]|uniref:interleukin-15 receptor subunit alpha-like isoform X3 n=1 Tax=Scyliorhinus canicula TaxID=7830 RepID=UPI0018F3609D|nr:interleukin-15 receptor subunit alpha-like isoform X3 [Scyliorhinus canicula]
MAGIKQLLVLCSILQATLAFKGSCSKPDFKVENVDLSEIMDTLFEVGQRLRLKCQSGYKRKAGTSNLIRCENNTQQIMWSKPNLMCITLTSLATSVESTSVESPPSAPTAGSISDHFTASTMDITVTTGLGPLATAWTAVRPSTPSASTAETEFEATVPSATTLKAAAETTVTNSIHGTTGTEPVTTRRAVTERTVKPTTASETASDVTVTLGTSDTNITAGKNIGLIVGTSAGSLFFITICVLLLLWVIVFQHKISCTRSQEYELAPMPSTEVQAVTNINETEPLQQETES